MRWNREVEPQKAAVSTYDELYGSWFEINGCVLNMTEDGLLKPLWRAAGT